MSTPPAGPLAAVFTVHLPALLGQGKGGASERTFGFVASTGLERGFWVVSLKERRCRAGTEADLPDVLVEADSAVLALFFAGGLDVPAALTQGVLRVRGEAAALAELVRFLQG